MLVADRSIRVEISNDIQMHEFLLIHDSSYRRIPI